MKAGAKKAAPRKKANGYKMPQPIQEGEVIDDPIWKQKWKIGPSIGTGGFGEIYSACSDKSPKKDYSYVVKVEPHENGPLFVEKNFYLKNCKKEDIEAFRKSRKLPSLGLPISYGCGSHDYKGEKYRYLVLERYAKDLWSIFEENGRSFPCSTVFQIGLQMLDVLEYIHSRGYVHADIKGANILLGRKKGTENQAYLVDFGLATRVGDGPFKPDPKSAHNGTIEYTSRDAHLGVPTYRGDLEILGYNMLQWLTGILPWEEKALKKVAPATIQQLKIQFMDDVRNNITKEYPAVPDELIKYFEYINTIKPKDKPDYMKCRRLFEARLKSEGTTRDSKLNFSVSKAKKTLRNIVDSPGSTDKIKETTKRVKKAQNHSDEVDSPQTEASRGNTIEKLKKIRKKRLPRGRPGRSKTQVENGAQEIENGENKDPDISIEMIPRRTKLNKRKSLEPNVVVNVKKTKMTPRPTPPTKTNHTDMATQTSLEKKKGIARVVSFDSPVSKIIDERKKNVSADMFEDSFDEGNKPAIEEECIEIYKRIVKKKVTTTVKRTKSKKSKAVTTKENVSVFNGRSPRKS